MDEASKYKHHIPSGNDAGATDERFSAVCERLEAIASALEGIERGLRNLAMMSGLDRVAKNPEILRELGKSFAAAAAGKDEKPNG